MISDTTSSIAILCKNVTRIKCQSNNILYCATSAESKLFHTMCSFLVVAHYTLFTTTMTKGIILSLNWIFDL